MSLIIINFFIRDKLSKLLNIIQVDFEEKYPLKIKVCQICGDHVLSHISEIGVAGGGVCPLCTCLHSEHRHRVTDAVRTET